ncbi:YunG family protein [Promicromonospora sukumoe]
MTSAGVPSTPVDLVVLREALEASWDERTSYGGVQEEDNPALGQCYPTSRVVQHFLPAAEIVKGVVRTRDRDEVHFWNEVPTDVGVIAVDLTWQQFPPGSVVTERRVLDRDRLGDSPPTVARCDLLLARVRAHLGERLPADRREPQRALGGETA